MASEIKVDTISEKTSANGVTIDGVNIKDSALATAGSVPLSTIDIDGGTDIGAAVVDADLFIIDDGAGGTNRKVTASRIKTYAGGAVTAINNATANELVTIGSTTTELDAESGLTYTDGALVIGGTTPSLTIGDAGAEDTKIVFDGNAQDFHIGLDDTADSLVIGLGSALGTTTHMSFDATGAITKPLQPAFLCRPSSNQGNLAINTALDVAFATEVFDQNADFSTPSFTAPVAGRYQLSYAIAMMEVDSASYFYFEINTSNRNYTMYHLNTDMLALDGYYAFTASVLADMDASDTAKIVIRQASGTAQADIRTDGSFFSGYLAC